jgi:hypothetical protein
MTVLGIILILDLVLLWSLFLSASNLFAKILLLALAVLNTWVALEHFRFLPTHVGSRIVFRG